MAYPQLPSADALDLLVASIEHQLEDFEASQLNAQFLQAPLRQQSPPSTWQSDSSVQMQILLPEFDDTRNDLLARLSALDNTLESVSLGGAVR